MPQIVKIRKPPVEPKRTFTYKGFPTRLNESLEEFLERAAKKKISAEEIYFQYGCPVFKKYESDACFARKMAGYKKQKGEYDQWLIDNEENIKFTLSERERKKEVAKQKRIEREKKRVIARQIALKKEMGALEEKMKEFQEND